jgi:periplasmic divalent cation tolerance protein
MEPVVFLYITAPDEAVAARIAETLVEMRAAACVNIFPPIRSVYRWNNAIESAQEVAMIVKTTARKALTARALIEGLHPYEIPAIAALAIDPAQSGEKFLAWLVSEVSETLP